MLPPPTQGEIGRASVRLRRYRTGWHTWTITPAAYRAESSASCWTAARACSPDIRPPTKCGRSVARFVLSQTCHFGSTRSDVHSSKMRSTVTHCVIGSWFAGCERETAHARTGAMLPAAQVGSLQRADLRNYIARWERPDASVFGVAGNLCCGSLHGRFHKVSMSLHEPTG